MQNLTERAQQLGELLRQRILVLDGAMGTMLQQADLTAEDFGGAELEGCNENLVLTRPDVIPGIHRKYFEAGADIVETNTFGSTRIVLAEYGLADAALTRSAAPLLQLARAGRGSNLPRQRSRASSRAAWARPRKSLTVTGGMTFEELRDNYHEQARGLVDGGADILLLETCQDTRNIKAGVLAIQQLERELGHTIPLMVSGDDRGDGHDARGPGSRGVVGFARSPRTFVVGLNCATGPEFMTDHIRTIASLTPRLVSCYPNAGLPNEEGAYLETPTTLAGATRALYRRMAG